MNLIEETFARLGAEKAKAFIPYIMAGDPSAERTIELFGMLHESGADIVELGVPFSDPLADGPTIQAASERALKGGMDLRGVLGVVRKIRTIYETPIVLMTYYNPVYRYGVQRFVEAASRAGVNGLIVPDLPPEEGGMLREAAKTHGLSTIFLLAPTSTPSRIKKVASDSTGFIYYVSITGITGGVLKVSGIKESIKKIKAVSNKPVAVGFGVSTAEEARKVAGWADGVIVGSAIVKKAANGKSGGLKGFLRSLREAI